jgi:phosphatidylglycerol:prolipoprotein diacylglycerol transferase
MLPVLISFKFPEFLGHLGWLEIAISVGVVVGLFLWRRRQPRFSLYGFGSWVVGYIVLRAVIWYAGPGYHFKLHTYGVMIAIGFVVGIYLAVRQARREYVDPNVILDLSFWILIAAMVGSRVLFIIVNIKDYMADPLAFVKIWQGGLVFYGGFVGALAASWYYCNKYGINFFRISDIMIPSVALGQYFGRLGCFSAGCCHGCATGIDSYGAIFTSVNTVVARSKLLGVPIHPTQLYESFGELAIFILLIVLRKKKRYHGQLLVLWLLIYPVWRFLTEMFRGDIERGVHFSLDLFGDSSPELLSTSQLVSLGLIALGVFLWFILRKSKAEPTASS